jgi:thymidylate synthase ThyX
MTETSPDTAKVIVDRIAASQKGLQEVETAILKSLQTYSETVTEKMDELVQLNLPSESERKAAEQVREAVLTMTTDIIRMVKDSIPKPNSSS